MTNKDLAELSRLIRMYPLFKFEHQKEDMYKVFYTEHSAFHFTIEKGRINRDAERMIINEHMRKFISKDLMEIYTNLYISTHDHKDGIIITVWIKRNNRDAESVGHIGITSLTLQSCLKYWDEEAGKALQPDWFFCTGCQEAYPRTEFDYFYFAGNYCHKCAERNPGHKKQALNESYN